MEEEEDVLVRKARAKGKGRKMVRPLGGEVGELVERSAVERGSGDKMGNGRLGTTVEGLDGVIEEQGGCGADEESEDEILARTMYKEGDERRRRHGYTIVKHRPP